MTQQSTPLPTTDQSPLWVLPPTWGTKKLSAVAIEDAKQVKPANNATQIYNYWGLDAIERDQFQEPGPNYVSGSTIDSTCVEFNESHILYSKLRPYLNKVIVPSLGGIGTTEWIVIQPNQALITRKYLAYMLRTKTFIQYATKNSTGARMPRMRKEALWSFDVPLPYPHDPSMSLHIQRAIVARIESLLDELREIRNLHDAIDRDLTQVMDSVFDEALKTLQKMYPSKTIASLINEKKLQMIGGGTPKTTEPSYWNGNIPWVSPKDMKQWLINDAEKYITQLGFDNSSAKLISPPSVLFVVRGMILAHSWPISITTKDVTINQDMKALSPNDELDAKYLGYVFRALESDLLRQVETAAHGTKRLKTETVEQLEIPFPPKEVQQQMVAYLDNIQAELIETDQIQSEDRSILEQVEEAILEQAFRGEL